MKILLLGGAGYLGSTLAPMLLALGHKVTVFDCFLFGPESLASLSSHPNFHCIQGDLTDIQQVSAATSGQEAVILLAALVGEPACDKDPEKTVAINYLGALNALKAAVYHKVKRFIFTSTDSCYGAQEKVNLSESAPLKPISLYAELKAKVETEILGTVHPDFFHPTVLRLATLYGLSPRMRFDLVINLLAREVTVGGVAKIFSGEQWRPLVHVKDAAKAFCLTLAAHVSLVSGQIFNVGSNEQNVQFKDLAVILQKAVPTAKIETVPQPPDLRDYHVAFDKIKNALHFNVDYEPSGAIGEIRDAILSGAIINPYDQVYKNA
ncbi:MAG: NAD-dependent epimerase/dehydratase family protein [Candidatus Adiutrix sp.]